MSKHTPGPWRNEGGDIIGYYTEYADNRIASVNYGHKLEKANANLIASAPDLLEALELSSAVLAELSDDVVAYLSGSEGLKDKARAAIKRARGEG